MNKGVTGKCPKCKGRIQATAEVWLDRLVILNGTIVGFIPSQVDSSYHAGGFPLSDCESWSLYCENDHSLAIRTDREVVYTLAKGDTK